MADDKPIWKRSKWDLAGGFMKEEKFAAISEYDRWAAKHARKGNWGRALVGWLGMQIAKPHPESAGDYLLMAATPAIGTAVGAGGSVIAVQATNIGRTIASTSLKYAPQIARGVTKVGHAVPEVLEALHHAHEGHKIVHNYKQTQDVLDRMSRSRPQELSRVYDKPTPLLAALSPSVTPNVMPSRKVKYFKIPSVTGTIPYKVKNGDTVIGIARQHGMQPNDLIKINPGIRDRQSSKLRGVDYIVKGETLNIPAPMSRPLINISLPISKPLISIPLSLSRPSQFPLKPVYPRGFGPKPVYPRGFGP